MTSEIRPHHALAVVALVLAVVFTAWSGVRDSTLLPGSLGVVGVWLSWWLGRGEWRTIAASSPHVMLVWSTTIVFLGESHGMFVNTSPSTSVYVYISGFVTGVLIPTLGSIMAIVYRNTRKRLYPPLSRML